MIRSIEFDLVTFSPNAVRFTTVQGQRGHTERVKKQRKAVRDVLVRHFGAHTPGLFVVLGNEVKPNKIAVSFTRIAAGVLDAEENLPMAFKHIKDEVADWCGAKSDRDPIFGWGPYRQEKAAPHVQRVRIEVEDLAPGEPRRLVLAETASAGREATARVKREVKAATKRATETNMPRVGKSMDRRATLARMGAPTAYDLRDAAEGVLRRGATLVYRPAEGAAAASSGARARAEASFAKMTGRAAPALKRGEATYPERSNGPNLSTNGPGEQAVRVLTEHFDAVRRQDPEALAVDRAAARVLRGEAPDPRTSPDPRAAAAKLLRDPGDEAPARDLADCETCGAKVPSACKLDVGGRVVFGVHVARARAAGLHVPEDDRAHVRPKRYPSDEARLKEALGWPVPRVVDAAPPRRLATVPGQARLVARRVYVVPPWEPGAMYRQRQLEDVLFDKPTAPFRVPIAHVARWGRMIDLHREERTIATLGVCWVYLHDPRKT